MKMNLKSLFVLPLILVVGCQSTPTREAAPSLAPSLPTLPPSTGVALHRGAITTDQAFQNVLTHSPQIRSLSAEIRAREAEAYQASLRPNPKLEFEAENFGGTGNAAGFSSAELTTGLSQEIQLGGKRKKRTRVAQLEADSLRAELSRVKLSLQISSEQKFVNLLEAQSLTKLAEEGVRIADDRLAAIQEQLDAGKVSRLDVNKANIALSSARQKLRKQEAETAKAASELGRLWGGDGTAITQAQGTLSSASSIASWPRIESAINRHPALSRSRIELAKSEATLEVEQAERIPNIEIGGGFRELGESDDTAAVIGFKIPLPFFDRNQGGIRAAEERIVRANSDQAGIRSSLRAQYRQLHAEAMSARDRVRALNSGMIDAARQSFDDNQTAYLEGKRDFIEYLDAQRTFFEVRRQEVRAKAELRRAKCAIDHLLNYRPTSNSR